MDTSQTIIVMSKAIISVLQTVLKLSNISYTSLYLDQLVKAEPEKDNLYGIVKILQIYGLVFDVHRIESPCATNLPNCAPFITEYKDNIIIVYKIDNLYCSFYKDGKLRKEEYNQFCSNWSGVVAKFVVGESSGEPFYDYHKKLLLIKSFKDTILYVLSMVILASFLVLELFPLSQILIFILSILGSVISYNIIISHYVDIGILHKICDIFSHSSCINLTNDSTKSYISILGFSFFIAIVFFIITSYIRLEYLSVIILFSSVEVLWSIVSQLKSKRYCILCCMVQLILVVMIILVLNDDFSSLSLWCIVSSIILFSFFMGYIYIISMCFFSDFFNTMKINNQMTHKTNNLIEDYISILPTVQKAVANNLKCNEQDNILLFLNPFCRPCKYEFIFAYNILRNGINGKEVIPVILTTNNKKPELIKWLLSGSVVDRMKNLYEWYSHESTNNIKHSENNGMSDSNVAKVIDMNMKLANKYRVTSTPAIVYGGVKISNCISIKDVLLTQ